MDALSCLAPPPALLQATDAAIARALHLSISSAASTPAAYCCDSVLVADSPPTPAARRHLHKQQHLAPAAGRAAGKTKQRRSRASKRAPTTYITTDPANFRIMVQQITGVQADIDQPTAAIDVAAAMLMAADASASGNPLQLPVPVPDHHQQQPCFPTLDSWNVVMYDHDRSDHLLL